MGVSVQITDAAHSMGFDHFYEGIRTGFARTDTAVGTASSVVFSWGTGTPPLGVPLSATITTTGGMTIALDFKLFSSSSAQITSMQFLNTASQQVMHSINGPISINSSITAFTAASGLMGGDDRITGNSYDNVLRGWSGNDVIDGGAGTDTAYYSGFASSYTVTRAADRVTVTGFEGTDTLFNVERVSFADKNIAFDTAGAAGQAYRLYQAAFNRKPDVAGLSFQIKTLDGGWGLKAVAQNFLASAEFSRTFGSLSNTQFVSKLYDNVLHRAADTAGLAFHAGALDSGSADRAQLLVNFSESPENQATLIGTIQTGMTYSL